MAQNTWQAEWEQRRDAAKKEGKVVMSIPPGAELRKALEGAMKQKFGIDVEMVLGSSSRINRRVADEFQAGVRYFDVIGTDRRLVADSLARGKVSITIGPTYYSFVSYIKSGLPIKPFPPFKEGTYVSVGNGGPVVIKILRTPTWPEYYMARVLYIVNWLLSREGQELYSKAQGQATRRLDVDTKWMAEIGVRAAKDYITPENYYKNENQSQDKTLAVRRPAQKFAEKVFK